MDQNNLALNGVAQECSKYGSAGGVLLFVVVVIIILLILWALWRNCGNKRRCDDSSDDCHDDSSQASRDCERSRECDRSRASTSASRDSRSRFSRSA